MRIFSTIPVFVVSLAIGAAIARGDQVPSTGLSTLSIGPADIVYLSDSQVPGLNSGAVAVYAGQLDWTPVGQSQVAFSTFCIDISTDIFLGQNYNFDIYSLGSTQITDGKTLTATQSSNIELLWGNYYNSIQGNPDKAAAFQIDIWKLIYGSNLVVTQGWGSQGWTTYQANWLNNLGTTSVPLVALDSTTAQDQTTDSFVGSVNPNFSPIVPIPSSFAGGIVLCAGMAGFARIRKAIGVSKGRPQI